MAIEYEIASMHVELLVKKLKVWYRKGIIRFWNNMRYSSKEPEKSIVLGAEKDHETTFFLLKKTAFSCHFTRTLNSVQIIKGAIKLDTWQIYCNRPVTKSGSGLFVFLGFRGSLNRNTRYTFFTRTHYSCSSNCPPRSRYYYPLSLFTFFIYTEFKQM